MYHREFPIAPTQQATNGALDMFVEGCRKDDLRQQRVALSVLRSSTEAQLGVAMTFAQASQQVTRAQIDTMLVR